MGIVTTMLESLSGGHGLVDPPLTHAIQGVVGTDGSPGPGIPWLLEQLSRAGHADLVQSWRHGDAQRPISSAALHTAIGDADAQDMASRAGLSVADFIGELSEHLPGIVSRLSATGSLPQKSVVDHW